MIKELIKNMDSKKYILFMMILSFIIPYFADAAVTTEKLGVETLNDFVLEPAKNEVILEPGQSSIEKISVINRMGKTINFQIEVEDIVGSDNIYEQVKLLGDEKGPYSLKDFIIPEITEFTLEAGEKITIPVSVDLPDGAEPRGYYGALIVSSKGAESDVSESDTAKGVTKIVTRLGSVFLVKINGDLKESSNLADFKTIGPKKMFYAEHPQGFEVSVKNTGNVHLVHYGEIKIKNIFGKEVTNLPLNAFFSLPDSTRYREIKWPESFSFGYYKAEINLYQGFDGDSKFLNDQISFVVLPWKILVSLAVLIVIIYLLFRFIKTNFKIERKA